MKQMNGTETSADNGGGGDDDDQGMINVYVRCCLCDSIYSTKNLEQHICVDHLMYFPYSCGHCNHCLPTQEMTYFHANMRRHLPVRIHENLNVEMERRLRAAIQRSHETVVTDGILSLPSQRSPALLFPTQYNEDNKNPRNANNGFGGGGSASPTEAAGEEVCCEQHIRTPSTIETAADDINVSCSSSVSPESSVSQQTGRRKSHSSSNRPPDQVPQKLTDVLVDPAGGCEVAAADNKNNDAKLASS